MNEAQLDEAVNRFLGWRFPADFNPDGGITFDKRFPNSHEYRQLPVGTNLLTATQAKAMLRHALAHVLNGQAGIPEAKMVHACTYQTDLDVVVWEVPMPKDRNVQLFAVESDVASLDDRFELPPGATWESKKPR